MLAIGNLFYLAWSFWYRADQTDLTFVGLDSFALWALQAPVGSALQGGQWNPALATTQTFAQTMLGNPVPVAVVTLAPRPTYGHFLEVVRNLKAQKRCNVLVVENSWQPEMTSPDEVIIPAFVLCGYAAGDAGFSGTLPKDGTLLAYQKARINAEWERLTQSRTIVDY